MTLDNGNENVNRVRRIRVGSCSKIERTSAVLNRIEKLEDNIAEMVAALAALSDDRKWLAKVIADMAFGDRGQA